MRRNYFKYGYSSQSRERQIMKDREINKWKYKDKSSTGKHLLNPIVDSKISSLPVVKFRAISSYGIILIYKEIDKDYKDRFGRIQYKYNVMVVKRRDSFAYCDLIRGCLTTDEKIKKFIPRLTEEERQRIFSFTFEELWNDFWVNNKKLDMTNQDTLKDYQRSKTVFEGIVTKYKDLLEKPSLVPENWYFPKGRRRVSETALECALREFQEETNIQTNNLKLISSAPPLEEFYKGTDDKIYRTVYFLFEIDHIPEIKYINTESKLRKKVISDEVSDMKWCSFYEASKLLDTSRKNILLISQFILGIGKNSKVSNYHYFSTGKRNNTINEKYIHINNKINKINKGRVFTT